MRKTVGLILIFTALFLSIAVNWQDGQTYCVIFPQNGRDIFGVAQRNIIIFGEDEVSLIPQVNFEGDASDFGILVPVPTEPVLAIAGANAFNEASFMTQPITRRTSSGCGCDNESNSRPDFLFARADFGDAAMLESGSAGVTVVYEQVVGMFQAVVLQATDVVDLTTWLNDNDYRYNAADADLLQDYVSQNWYFVAMKLDPAQAPPVINQWWNATTAPAKITFAYSASSLTYPLKISAISTNEHAEVLIYTIGKDPMRFPGATVEYANEIDSDEADALKGLYPQFSDFIAPGSFVTKLRKIFPKSEMKDDIEIVRSDDRREFRQVSYIRNDGFGFAALSLLVLGILLRRKN